jgi:hypothetical protein
MTAQARAVSPKKKASLVAVAPDDEAETRHKLSPAKGVLIGAGICAVFWAAVAAVMASR